MISQPHPFWAAAFMFELVVSVVSWSGDAPLVVRSNPVGGV